MVEFAPTNYISRKASLRHDVFLEGYDIILGPSTIGENSLIGYQTVIGYPIRRKLLKFIEKPTLVADRSVFSQYDEVSRGAILGANCIIRSFSIIYENVKLGRSVETGHNVLIREDVVVEDGTLVGSNSLIEGGGVEIGRSVSIQSAVFIPAPTVIGNKVFIGPRVCFTNDRYPPSKARRKTIVEDEAIIGANAIISAGIRIGEASVVAAGSVVTRDVPRKSVVKGAPARRHMTRDQFEAKKRKYEKG
jgi:acetyltransferase-like isoleucine patch superfamily enzyme